MQIIISWTALKLLSPEAFLSPEKMYCGSRASPRPANTPRLLSHGSGGGVEMKKGREKRRWDERERKGREKLHIRKSFWKSASVVISERYIAISVHSSILDTYSTHICTRLQCSDEAVCYWQEQQNASMRRSLTDKWTDFDASWARSSDEVIYAATVDKLNVLRCGDSHIQSTSECITWRLKWC